ncbi:ABC transporter ATP-binding protein [Methylocella sp.]|uniref:ABC transporter ATP-binding protein n=1 Tax=Methylocella sp. TaxID=1978226 RepID=UPI0037840855
MSFLRLEGVGKRFGATRALEDVSLDMPGRGRLAVVGPSGSGKSTLLRVVAGFEAPDEGRILLDGEALVDGGVAVPAHRRAIGVVAQDGALFPHLDIEANIGFGLPRRAPDRRARVLELIDLVELEPSMLTRRPHQLSGGQQQRVALARALARRPRLMLLDEPFSALDTGLRDQMRRTVAHALDRAGAAAVLVTHDQAEALAFADQVAVLRDGRLAQVGAPRALYFAPRDPKTATFLGDAVILPAEVRDGHAHCALGRLDVEAPARPGPGRLMVRPEQLRLRALAAYEGADAPVRARVEAVEFGGGSCALRLRLLDAPQVPEIALRAPSLGCAGVGDVLALSVEGPAWLFE